MPAGDAIVITLFNPNMKIGFVSIIWLLNNAEFFFLTSKGHSVKSWMVHETSSISFSLFDCSMDDSETEREEKSPAPAPSKKKCLFDDSIVGKVWVIAYLLCDNAACLNAST